jgi:hypothetical protein
MAVTTQAGSNLPLLLLLLLLPLPLPLPMPCRLSASH